MFLVEDISFLTVFQKFIFLYCTSIICHNNVPTNRSDNKSSSMTKHYTTNCNSSDFIPNSIIHTNICFYYTLLLIIVSNTTPVISCKSATNKRTTNRSSIESRIVTTEWNYSDKNMDKEHSTSSNMFVIFCIKQ